jgi:hypothetical protein
VNRDVVPEAALAVAGAVFLALALAATGSRRALPAGRGTVVRGLVYPLLLASVAMAAGATLPVLLGIVVLICLPLVAARAATRAGVQPAGSAGRVPALARAVVAAGLITVVLIAAGESVSLLGRVDARTTVVVIGASAAAVALLDGVAEGLSGSARVGLWAFWLLLPTVAVTVSAGVALGSPGDLVRPAVTVAGPAAVQWVAWALLLAALGWADPALNRAVAQQSTAGLVRVGAALVGVVLASGLGLLLLLGGTVVGPSMQLSVLPANIDLVPGAVFVVILGVTLAAVAMVAALLSAAGSGLALPPDPAGAVPDRARPWQTARGAPVVAVTVAAVVAALLASSVEAVAVVSALVGAAVLGSEVVRRPVAGRVPPGLAAGLGAAVVSAVVLGVAGRLGFGGASVVALGVVAAVAAAAQARSGQRALTPA